MRAALALVLGAVAATVCGQVPPSNPTISPIEGFSPLRVFITSGSPPNDTNTAVVFSLDAVVDQVECNSPRGERVVNSIQASSVFKSSVLIRAKVCHDFNGESGVTTQQVVVKVWVGWNPVIVVWVVTCAVVFSVIAFLSKIKLRGNFTTWYSVLSVLPVVSFFTYVFFALDLLTIAQANNVAFATVILVFLALGGGLQLYFAHKIMMANVEDDKKFNWWYNHHMGAAKYIVAASFVGIGTFTTVFSRLMDADVFNAGCDTVNLVVDLKRRLDRYVLVGWLTADLVVVAMSFFILTRNDPEDIVPTSTIAVAIVSIIALLLNGVRVLYGFVNLKPLDPRNRSTGFVAPKGDEMFLKMEAAKEAEEKLRGEKGAPDGAGAGTAAAAKPETKAQKRQRLLAEARAKRTPFNPLSYPRRHKYTKRPFPKFADMT